MNNVTYISHILVFPLAVPPVTPINNGFFLRSNFYGSGLRKKLNSPMPGPLLCAFEIFRGCGDTLSSVSSSFLYAWRSESLRLPAAADALAPCRSPSLFFNSPFDFSCEFALLASCCEPPSAWSSCVTLDSFAYLVCSLLSDLFILIDSCVFLSLLSSLAVLNVCCVTFDFFLSVWFFLRLCSNFLSLCFLFFACKR